jgi:hypothetical protein
MATIRESDMRTETCSAGSYSGVECDPSLQYRRSEIPSSEELVRGLQIWRCIFRGKDERRWHLGHWAPLGEKHGRAPFRLARFPRRTVIYTSITFSYRLPVMHNTTASKPQPCVTKGSRAKARPSHLNMRTTAQACAFRFIVSP